MQDVLRKHNLILNNAVESNNGFVFKTVGDAFCCAFQNAEEALKAAVKAQELLSEESWGLTPVKVRMGIHSGYSEWSGIDYMGYITLARTARIMSAANGEQIIISEKTLELAKEKIQDKISFRDLGIRRLKDVIKPIKLFQVISPELRAEFPPLKTLDARPNNLPLQLTSFIGREEVISEVKSLFTQTRLLTITGTGGSGKTRLALQTGADMIDDFANGVFITELAPVKDPDLLVQTILNSLGVKEEAGKSPQETLTIYIKGKSIMIILDNCEHLINECADTVETLLSKSQKLKIIATSREALNCLGEQTYKLPPMLLPDPSSNTAPEMLTKYESIRLFIERALSVNTNFRLNENNAQALAEICNRLDGIPLAIELAAARINLLSVEKIHERLDNRFNLLTGGKRTALPRQQTLKALIDWSYDLLSEIEKKLWNRLSVFNGGWTLEAAEEICSDDKTNKSEILDLLGQLIEKSIISYDDMNARYKMLETIKDYGEEKLNQDNESAKIFSRHLDYYTEFSESAEPIIEQSEGVIWLDKLENDHINLQSAIEWSMNNMEKEKGARIAIALGRFWIIRGHLTTGKRLLENILRNLDGLSKKLTAQVYSHTGSLLTFQGEYEEAQNFFDKGLILQREIKDKSGIAYSLSGLGNVLFATGNYDYAKGYFLESLGIYREIGYKIRIASILNNLGNLEYNQGNNEPAKKYYEESIAYCHELGNKNIIVAPLLNLGSIFREEEKYEHAKEYFLESLNISREQVNKRGIAHSLHNLAQVECELGNNDSAVNLLNECMVLSEEIGDKREIATSLLGLGISDLLVGNYSQAQKYLEKAHALRKKMKDKTGIIVCLNLLAALFFLTGKKEIALRNIEMSTDISLEFKHKLGMGDSLIILAGILNNDNKISEAINSLGAVESGVKHTGVMEIVSRKLEEKIIKELQEKISKEEFERYFEEGKKLTLEEACKLAMSSL